MVITAESYSTGGYARGYKQVIAEVTAEITAKVTAEVSEVTAEVSEVTLTRLPRLQLSSARLFFYGKTRTVCPYGPV